jgi:hypothetical protein
MKARWDRWLLTFAVALAIAGSIGVLTQSRTSREAADFTFYYSAAVLVREGHPAAPYDQKALGAMIHRVAPESAVDRRLPFNLPIAAVLPLVPLTLLPLDLAFRAWQFADIAILLLTVLVLQRAYPLGRAGSALGFVGIAASVPAWSVLTEAQLTPLPVLGGALLVAALRTDALSMAAAGGLLLAVKPHFLPAYLIMLVGARRWRPLLAALAGAATLLLSPLAAGGLGGMEAMVRNALGTNQLVSIRLTEAWIGLLAVVLPAAVLTLVSLALYLGTLAVLAALAARRPGSIPAFAALVLWVGMLASPHVLPHDLLLLAPSVWLTFWLFRKGRMPVLVLALIVVDLALLIDLRGVGLVVAPIAMTAVAVWAVVQVRRRADSPRSLDTAAAA